MFTFITGIQPKTRVLEDKQQTCPVCKKARLQKVRVDHMLSVFFIPLFPVQRGEPFFVCPECPPRAGEEGDERRDAGSGRPMTCRACGRRLEQDFVYCPGCGRLV